MRTKFIWPFVSFRRYVSVREENAELMRTVKALRAQADVSKSAFDRETDVMRARVRFLQAEQTKLTALLDEEKAVSERRLRALDAIRAALRDHHRK